MLQLFFVDIAPVFALESGTAKKLRDKSWSPLESFNLGRSKSEQVERSAA
jgi:hypothetical protein